MDPVLKPTACLEEALQSFQNALSAEDKTRLDIIKGVPDADAAITFTAELDRENTHRRGASLASRLYAFMQSMQQFSAVVDTFVSSNPTIAALVWGIVKLTMLVSPLAPYLLGLG
ncbi:hypothetical protein F4780DRAFT_216112 [Xylariomycetidae sp. FL0641]|nr:hypothetical protein F4780DRAFT_216112 [Xylariomycetidae sp. FL0641]